MTTDSPSPSGSITRRSVATGLAWSVPTAAAVVAAPAYAASLRKDPGINGWVLNSATSLGRCRYTLEVDSKPSNPPATADGAPYGLYLYDTAVQSRYDAASLTYWIRGDHKSSNPVTWTTGPHHSRCWSGPVAGTPAPVAGTPAKKADGFTYTPYTWTYTCDINPAEVSRDGRLYLRDFNVVASFTQATVQRSCEPLDYWTYREIRVDVDGSGPQKSQIKSFERRNGASGPFTTKAGARMAPASIQDDGSAPRAALT